MQAPNITEDDEIEGMRDERDQCLPVLKKKEQFTLSFSVPKILARYSAIFKANLKIENPLESV